MAGTVIIPWYATGLRARAFGEALEELGPTALRHGATSYAVYQSNDDHYRFQQLASFPDHLSWERYWEGPEMTAFRSRYAGWYQIPVLYAWWSLRTSGAVKEPGDEVQEPVAAGTAPRGHTT